MANLTSVNINGALIRKEGTTTPAFSGATMFPASPQVFTTADISFACAAVDPNNANKIAVAFRDNDNGNRGKVRIGNVQTNNTIVWTEDSTFNGSDAAHYLSVDFDYSTSPIRIVVVYADQGNSGAHTARVGTLDGSDSITWGTKKVLNSSNGTFSYLAFDPNNPGKFAVSYNAKLSVCTISGSTITQGTEVTGNGGGYGGPVVWDPFDSAKFLYVYRLTPSDACKARVCEVSGTTITLRAEFTQDSDVTGYISAAANPSRANQFIVAYLNQDKGLSYLQVLTISGSAGSYTVSSPGGSADYVGNGIWNNVIWTNADNRVIVTYKDGSNSNYGTARAATINQTNHDIASLDAAVIFNSVAVGQGASRHTVFDRQTNKFIAAYDTGDTDGVAIVGIPKTNVITIDLSTGNYFEVDLETATSNIDTFTITETLSGTQAQTFYLKVTQGSTARQFNWAYGLTNIKWPGSSGPTLSTGNNAVDIFKFTTYDQGTTWHGETIGLNFS